MKKIILLLSTLWLINHQSQAQYTAVDSRTAAQLVEKLTGEGVEILSSSLDCAPQANGTFEGVGDLGIDSGIVLTTGRVNTSGFELGVFGAYDPFNIPSTSVSRPGDTDLNSILTGTATRDACILEFQFIPAGDSIKFNYVFGSSEYKDWSCSVFNDVFGFFISGGGFATPTNIATVPGTTIPVCVNSTTGETTGALCTAMGPGSPFSMFYNDNEGGLSITYGGFTTIFQAKAAVSPCDTYTLKLAIADGSPTGTDDALDSGVFLEAGSLSSTGLTVETTGAPGAPEMQKSIVRGCGDGFFRIHRASSIGTSLTVNYHLSGTAVNGIDYASLPGIAVIPPGSNYVEVPVTPLPSPGGVSPKSLIVSILDPYACGGAPMVLSSDTLWIYDSLEVDIIQNDTIICIGNSVDLSVEASDYLDIVWTPVGAVTPDPTARAITVTPTATTTYRATATLASLPSCPGASDIVTVVVKQIPIVDAGPDTYICLGGEKTFNPTITPTPDDSYTYAWTPVVPTAGIVDPTVKNATVSPTLSTTYYLSVNSGAPGCDGSDSVRVAVLPNDIELLNTDISVCKGEVVPLNANGRPEFTYRWTPETDVVDPFSMNTSMVANTSGLVTVTASHPGCFDMVKSFYLDVQPIPNVDAGPDRVICSGDTVRLIASTDPVYPSYTYKWTPGDKLTDSTIKDPIFNGYSSQTYELIVTTPIGCEGRDTIHIQVNNSNFTTVNVSDTGICPNESVQLEASGAIKYEWIPSAGLSNDTIPNPIASPNYSTNYVLLATSPDGCVDSKYVNITVHPEAVTTLPDSVQVYPGEQYEIDMVTNAHYFNWFPPEGLNYTDVPNPIASPDVRTRYYVDAITEQGCTTRDSIDIVVNLESIFQVPNAFVPGNAQVNNGTFKIVRRGEVELLRFTIYNRWGNKVFETTDINQGWDGRFNGEAQPAGVYVYIIEGRLNTGRVVSLKGNVTLLR